jgi:Pectate lyase superfamily protein/Right handed beta helix region
MRDTRRRFLLGCLLSAACVAARAQAPRPGPLVISVASFGAVGDGRTDDTVAIQGAVDAVPRGGTVQFPHGTYSVRTDTGVHLKDDIHVDLGDATLVGANHGGARCRILEVSGCSNVTISGGTLLGSRAGSPEWGVGILASDAQDLVIENVTLRDFYFDGILLTGNRGCRHVVVRHCLSANNRRTGLAVPSATDVLVESSTFTGSHGQSPEAGINCEPGPGAEVHDVRVTGSTFSDNAGIGFYAHRALGVSVSDITVNLSTAAHNRQGLVLSGVDGGSITANHVIGHRDPSRSGIALGDGTEHVMIVGNHLEDNYRGILSAGATGSQIRDNQITGLGARAGGGENADGIVCRGLRGILADACLVSGNVVAEVAGSGIVAALVARVQLRDNDVGASGRGGIILLSATNSEVTGNRVANSGLENAGLYDAIGLVQSSNDNLVANNTCRLGPGTRQGVGVSPGCHGNRIFGNVVEALEGRRGVHAPGAAVRLAWKE